MTIDPAAARIPPLPPHHAEVERLERMAAALDTAFRIPGIGVRVGWDSILGLIPGVGDTVALAPGAYIVWRAHKLGADPAVVARMAVNSGVDYAIGAIPLIGDLFDVGFKANRRNVTLLREHLDARHAATGAAARTVNPTDVV